MQQGTICQDFVVKSGPPIKNTIISGYASVFNVADSHDDIIAKGAFRNISHSKVKLLWQHDTSRPIGIITSLYEDDIGLKMEADTNSLSKEQYN